MFRYSQNRKANKSADSQWLGASRDVANSLLLTF
jgi:hypothetical protein